MLHQFSAKNMQQTLSKPNYDTHIKLIQNSQKTHHLKRQLSRIHLIIITLPYGNNINSLLIYLTKCNSFKRA